jgi:uncharacterized protein YqhQ
MPRYTYGGQALIEGVLMRGRDAIAVAFRHPDGRIVWETERLDSGFHGSTWSKLPLLRGLVVLYETLIVGTRWLVRSAGIQAEEDGVELGKGSIIVMLVITLIAGVGVFFLLPLFIASVTTANVENQFVQHLVEGLVKVAIFLGYLWLIGQSADIRRVFQYHGAEHMTIHALEAGDPLVVDEVRKYPTAHPRCGTEFLVVVIALSIVAFSLRQRGYKVHVLPTTEAVIRAVSEGRAVHASVSVPGAVHPVGSGDCLLGGVAVGLARGESLEDVLRLGVACGAANALRAETGGVRREDVEALRPRVACVPIA